MSHLLQMINEPPPAPGITGFTGFTGFTRNQSIIIAIGIIVALCIAIYIYFNRTIAVTEPQYEDDEIKEPNFRHNVSNEFKFQTDPLFQPIVMTYIHKSSARGNA